MIEAAQKGFSFIRFFEFTLITLFIALIVLNASLTAIHEKSITPFFSEIGKSVFEPTSVLQEESQKIIDAGGIRTTGTGFSGFIDTFIVYIRLIHSILGIITWITLFVMIMSYLTNNTSAVFTNLLLAIIILYFAQVGYLAWVHWGDNKGFLQIASIPFKSIWTFSKAIPYIISPAIKVGTEVYSGNLSNFTK